MGSTKVRKLSSDKASENLTKSFDELKKAAQLKRGEIKTRISSVCETAKEKIEDTLRGEAGDAKRRVRRAVDNLKEDIYRNKSSEHYENAKESLAKVGEKLKDNAEHVKDVTKDKTKNVFGKGK